MPRPLLFYKDVLPLIPDSIWYTSRDIYQLLLSDFPAIKLGNLRVSLHLWEKKGLIISKPLLEENRYLNLRTIKLYRKAYDDYKGQKLGNQKAAAGKRVCLCCRRGFWPENKVTFMCVPCGQLHHE